METRFSLKRLFLSTALVAVGLAVMVRVVQVAGLFHWVIDFPVCFIAGRLLGRWGLGAIQAGGAWCGDRFVVVGSIFDGGGVEVVSRGLDASFPSSRRYNDYRQRTTQQTPYGWFRHGEKNVGLQIRYAGVSPNDVGQLEML